MNAILDEDRQDIERDSSLCPGERQARMESLEHTREMFQDVFDEDRYAGLVSRGKRRLSHTAFKRAVSINLLRDEPLFQMPFQVCFIKIEGFDDVGGNGRVPNVADLDFATGH